MIVSIHQPNLFPWLGFFNKIYKANTFVYLNHTENNPRSAIYTKRVKIIVNMQEHWLTCSLKSESEAIFVPINKMIIDKPERLKDKHLKTIELSYKKAAHFSSVFPLIEEFYEHPSEFISERNIDFTENICDLLNIKTARVKSNTLGIKTASTQLLIDVVKKLGGDTYMPGGGAAGYQEDELFKENQIGITKQQFEHPIYEQFNTQNFVAGLSIIDALMNLGISKTEELIKNA